MKPEEYAWEHFRVTGKVDDYLEYCKARKQETVAGTAEGALAANATEGKWNYPAGSENRGG